MKTIEQVRGFKINCPMYDPCPLCFGCRAADRGWIKCDKCFNNEKFNVCNKKRHTVQALTLMLKPKI